MTSENKSIEIMPVDRTHTDWYQSIYIIDPMQSFHLFLAIFAVITAIKKLLRYIKKLTNGNSSRIELKLIFQIVGAILAILKAIEQLFDSLGDWDDNDTE
jgi:hypothetical protein